MNRIDKANGQKVALQKRLEKKHGVEDHPHRDYLFALAWDYGHSNGEEEVEMCYADFVGLIRYNLEGLLK